MENLAELKFLYQFVRTFQKLSSDVNKTYRDKDERYHHVPTVTSTVFSANLISGAPLFEALSSGIKI